MTMALEMDRIPGILHARVAREWNEFSACPDMPLLPEAVRVTLPQVWACSLFVAQHCLRDRGLLSGLCSRGDLERRYPAAEYAQLLQADTAGIEDEAALMSVLRRRRNREMVRIAWRDLAGWADLDETMGDLTRLADAATSAALNWLNAHLSARDGRLREEGADRAPLVVLGMGKLGGGELNYSSDIDLIFAYDPGDATPVHHAVTSEEHFTRLGHALIRVLSERTADGFVFRVDTLLRPFGKSGSLVIGFDAMERYYQTHGREWERYALIKARPVAGDLAAGERLLQLLRPFIYRRYLDYGAFEALRQMKAQIESHEASKSARDDIKLGRGGIREVEFIAQVYQLVRGGHEPQLQSRNLRPVLRLLGEQGHLPAYAVAELDEAYVFLRRVENRLQAYADEQVHQLPVTAEGQAALALGMGFDDWQSFALRLDQHRRKVHQHFERVFAAPQAGQPAADGDSLNLAFEEQVPEERARAALAQYGFQDAEAAAEFIRRLRQGVYFRGLSDQGRRRIEQLLPLLLGAVVNRPQPGQALLRVWQVVEAVARRVTYLSLLVENPMALSQLVALCAASPWITQQLARHPVLLDELLDPRTLYHPPRRAELMLELDQLATHLALEDIETQMDLLRRFQQTSVLRVAAADVGGSIPLMVVSDHLTEIAEVVVAHALKVAWRQMVMRHGRPPGLADEDHGVAAGFAVIAYGKFGGIELGYGSDLDLVFVYDGDERQMTGGERPLELSAFYTRMAQKLIHLLSTRTPAGSAYEVDMELRPSGQSGLLVTSLDAFRSYQLERAWTWEHQALVRTRAVAGDPALMQRFEAVRSEVLARPREPVNLLADVRDMRERMRQNLGMKRPGGFDIKHGRGGMIDIEFIVQYLVLRWTHDHPGLARWSDNIRQLEGLSRTGLLEPATADYLAEAYRTYRRRVHACALQETLALAREDEWQETRARITALWERMFVNSPESAPAGLAGRA
jgi:glutamate-ammonia-ligase adenylyltransferase